jgi:hypothetical protein
MWLVINSLFTLFIYAQIVLPWQEKRTCLVRITDIVHDILPRYNTSWIINVLEYMYKCHFLCHLLYWQTIDVSVFCLAVTFLMYARIIMLCVCPFKVSEQAFPLIDYSQKLVLWSVPFFENDLFFSAHIAMTILCGLCLPTNYSCYRFYYFLSAGLQGICMLFSKVHYTIDILVAPYISYGSYQLARWILTVTE